MKDKEKQIEEMAKDCCLVCLELYGDCKRKEEKCPSVKNESKRLIEMGWIKTDKDSVVLSREEKAKLVHIDTLKSIKSISQLRELLSNITAINDLMGYNDRELEIRQEERKETAEKIFKELKTRLKDCPEVIEEGYNVQNSVDYFEDIIGYDKFCADEIIKELAKQFGVEITTEDNCKYYDKVNMRCNGAKCTPECYCNGHKSECTEYPETRKQFGVEIKE